MLRYASLASMLIEHAKNGILFHITMKKSIEDLILLQPNLVSNIEKVTDFVLELSRALRTLLAWFREYKKYEETRRIILKHSNAGDKAILDQVVAKLVLRNADEETTENGRLHPPPSNYSQRILHKNRYVD